MKHVCVNAATCSCTRATTASAALPTLTTAMPAPRSMSELPSTSTSTPPPAFSMNTGSVVPSPEDTAALRRSISARERGPGISVTSRRSWGSDGPPRVSVELAGAGDVVVSVMVASVGRGSLPWGGPGDEIHASCSPITLRPLVWALLHDEIRTEMSPMSDVRPFYVAGRPETSDDTYDVVHPYDGRVVGTVAVPSADQVETAVRAAAKVAPVTARSSAAARADA